MKNLKQVILLIKGLTKVFSSKKQCVLVNMELVSLLSQADRQLGRLFVFKVYLELFK